MCRTERSTALLSCAAGLTRCRPSLTRASALFLDYRIHSSLSSDFHLIPISLPLRLYRIREGESSGLTQLLRIFGRFTVSRIKRYSFGHFKITYTKCEQMLTRSGFEPTTVCTPVQAFGRLSHTRLLFDAQPVHRTHTAIGGSISQLCRPNAAIVLMTVETRNGSSYPSASR